MPVALNIETNILVHGMHGHSDVCCLNLSWAVWLLRSGACLGWSRSVLGKVSAGLCAWSLGFDSPHHPPPPTAAAQTPTHPPSNLPAGPSSRDLGKALLEHNTALIF